ncbi:MAG: hypothetical protein ABTQ27_16615 [Amaricoccus sp.]
MGTGILGSRAHHDAAGPPPDEAAAGAASVGGSVLDLYAVSDPDDSDAKARCAPLDPYVVRTALSLLTRIVGLPLAAIDLPPPRLSIAFPKHAMPEAARAVFGAKRTLYQAWRRVLLDAQMIMTRGPVDDDPWDGIARAARLSMGQGAADAIWAAARRFRGEPPGGLTLSRAATVEAELPRKERPRFRHAIRVLADLHDHELAVATGLLPPRFGPLPPGSRFQDHVALPPCLAAAVATAPTAARMSLAYCWTMAVRTGEFPEDADPTIAELFAESRWDRLFKADPNANGVVLARKSWRACLHQARRLLTAVGAPDPRIGTAADDWAALTKHARETGRRVDTLSTLAALAKTQGLRPSEITSVWVAERLASLGAAVRGRLRRACLFVDALRLERSIPGALLPPAPTGIVRARRPRGDRSAPAVPRRDIDPLEQSWIDLGAALRRAGASQDDLNAVSAVRAEAIRQGSTPGTLDRAWFEQRRANVSTRTAAKISRSARLFDAFRAHPELRGHLPAAPIGTLQDRRRTTAEAGRTVAVDLARLLEAQGASASTHRAASVAVHAAAEALSRQGRSAEPASLADILRADFNALDWGRHAPRAEEHILALSRLRAFEDLPWTPEWRRLQATVVEAGIAMRDNPVPALLRRADGCGPAALDIPWAVGIDRELRRAGRADLARSFAAATRRLDALHAVPALAGSGLLPPVVGSVRETPAPPPPVSAPAPDPVAEAWSALAVAVRQTGRGSDVLSMLAPRAKADGLCPQDLSATWLADLLQATSPAQLTATRSALYLLDDLRDDPGFPAGLLPAEPTGLARQRSRRRAA